MVDDDASDEDEGEGACPGGLVEKHKDLIAQIRHQQAHLRRTPAILQRVTNVPPEAARSVPAGPTRDTTSAQRESYLLQSVVAGPADDA